ncbi:MAG TPA: SDR family oxidoreductase [Candidatus Dormibacteraeota bacterium]
MNVVVTGGNQGIGRAIALAFAREGARVAISARSRESLDAVAAEIGALAIPCDVSQEASVDNLGRRVDAELGAVDVVVPNAGIAGPTKPLQELTLDEWRECLAVDLDGVFLTFRRFIPGMIERGGGCLIAISSVTGKKPLQNRTPYAAAKMGVIGLVRTLAMEVGPHGIRVNAVCPGAVAGPRIEAVIERDAAARGITVEAARAERSETAALRRMVEPEEVAAACVFLASPGGAGITGEDLNVSAGRVMY